MKREELKKILETLYKSNITINHISRGDRKPNYNNMLILKEKHNIPFEAWRDIKSYLQNNDTKSKNK